MEEEKNMFKPNTKLSQNKKIKTDKDTLNDTSSNECHQSSNKTIHST
jgi:hypothetical protein